MAQHRRMRPGLQAALLCAGVLGAISSCALLRPSAPVVPPVSIPGAAYVGARVCESCHSKQAADFQGSVHSEFTVAAAQGEKPQIVEGCEGCHGPGSLHIADPKNKSSILRGDANQCMKCHLEVRTQFSFRYHHPVPEGRMSCTACHNPHEGLRPVDRVEDMNEKCFACHPDQRGPWAFPHQAVEEDGCAGCHIPHGSSVKKLLVADPANLCLRCHFDAAHHPGIASFGHSGGAYLLRGCENCHPAVHGSNFSEFLRRE